MKTQKLTLEMAKALFPEIKTFDDEDVFNYFIELYKEKFPMPKEKSEEFIEEILRHFDYQLSLEKLFNILKSRDNEVQKIKAELTAKYNNI